MKTIVLSFFAAILFPLTGAAQKTELWAKSGDKGLYLSHKVAPKESFFAIGRKYNITPQRLAEFNKLDINKGLKIDQQLQIPLDPGNFTQEGNSGTPVYYKSKKDETLAAIGKKHNNVAVSTLQAWNGVAKTNLKEGTQLIIGFVKSKELPSVTIAPKKVTDDEPAVVKNEKEEEKKEEITAIQQKEKPEEKKEEPAKEEKKTTAEGQGYFKTHFEQQAKQSPVTKNEVVTSGIFKTISGWNDAKYYLLIDKVDPGTIIKIINPDNKKAVFAKVLGQMSGIRQNAGLDIRISNAAAAALEVNDQEKFIVSVNY